VRRSLGARTLHGMRHRRRRFPRAARASGCDESRTAWAARRAQHVHGRESERGFMTTSVGPHVTTAARIDADVAIVGSGFAGSLTALCLLRRGRRVVIVERGRHPRFAIGESSTPLANLLIEELADRYDLPRIRPFSKWGTWQHARPEVACGLKRG